MIEQLQKENAELKQTIVALIKIGQQIVLCDKCVDRIQTEDTEYMTPCCVSCDEKSYDWKYPRNVMKLAKN